MRKKRAILFATFTIIFAMTTLLVEAQDSWERERSYVFQAGIGVATIGYPADVNGLLNELEDLPGVDRTKLHLNFGAGFAVSPNVYLVGSIQAYADRFDYSFYNSYYGTISGNTQFNWYLYGIGLRGYPMETGLVLGLDLGATRGVIQDSDYGTETSDWGRGGGVMVGYDFARRKTGFSALIAVRVDALNIDGDTITGSSLFLDLLFK